MALEDVFAKAWATVLRSPEMYMDGFKNGFEASSLITRPFRRVLVLGVGGSAIVGDIVSALKAEEAETEVITVRGLRTPHRLDSDTLVVAVSYSGETAETVNASIDALSKGATVMGISAGGRLTSFLTSKGALVVRVSEGLTPRYAVPEMVGALYGLLSNLKGFSGQHFLKAVEELRVFLKQFTDFMDNRVNDVAGSLIGKTAICISHSHLIPAAYRLKTQLNENAKHPAYTVFLPEACHNEIEGWTAVQGYVYIFQRSIFEPEIYSDMSEWMMEFIESRGGVYHEIKHKSDSHLSELLKHLAFADLISIALARLKKTDPFQLYIIPMLKALLLKYLP